MYQRHRREGQDPIFHLLRQLRDCSSAQKFGRVNHRSINIDLLVVLRCVFVIIFVVVADPAVACVDDVGHEATRTTQNLSRARG